MCQTTATCPRCGREFLTSEMVRSASRKRGNRSILVCRHCATVNERYHVSNNAVVGTPTKDLFMCGVEMETSYSDVHARTAMFEYSFIATHDGSLDSDNVNGERNRYGYYDGNTCEYVSPLMHGLKTANKFALTCDYLINNGHMKVNDSCGTHFHVSLNSMKDDAGNKTYIGYIQRFYHSLFIPLNDAMAEDVETMKAFFGRSFHYHYAKPITEDANPKYDRYLWINLTNDSNIEFRLNRFASGKQYQILMKAEKKMCQCIVEDFCRHFMDTNWTELGFEKRTHYRKALADKTAQKLVKIYKKYADRLLNS